MKSRLLLGLAVTLFLFVACSAFGINIPDVTFTTKKAGKVVFSHNYHITQKGISNNCKTCHDTLFDMKKKIRHTMAEMEHGKSCGACHNGSAAFGLPECVRCHKVRDVVIKVRETGPVIFRHSLHTGKGSCSDCHDKLFNAGPNKRVTMAQMANGKSCGACHNGTRAGGLDKCTLCHPVKDVTFQVKETGPITFSHARHLETVKCGGCHTKLYAVGPNKRVTMDQMAKGKSCGACHNGKSAFSVSECAKCHPVKDINFPEKTIGDALFSHSFHTGIYSCKECHTRIYRPSSGNKAVTMAAMVKGASCGTCHDGKTAFTVSGNCDKCHKH